MYDFTSVHFCDDEYGDLELAVIKDMKAFYAVDPNWASDDKNWFKSLSSEDASDLVDGFWSDKLE